MEPYDRLIGKKKKEKRIPFGRMKRYVSAFVGAVCAAVITTAGGCAGSGNVEHREAGQETGNAGHREAGQEIGNAGHGEAGQETGNAGHGEDGQKTGIVQAEKAGHKSHAIWKFRLHQTHDRTGGASGSGQADAASCMGQAYGGKNSAADGGQAAPGTYSDISGREWTLAEQGKLFQALESRETEEEGLTEAVRQNVILKDDTEIEACEWVQGGQDCLRVRVQYREQPEDSYRHKEDFFFFPGSGDTGVLYVDYAAGDSCDVNEDRYVWWACDFQAHFEDVTFDGEEDLLISLGHSGAHGDCIYAAYIHEEGVYRYEPTFEEIPNYGTDAENRVIQGSCTDSASSYTKYEYQYVNQEFMQTSSITGSYGGTEQNSISCRVDNEGELERFLALFKESGGTGEITLFLEGAMAEADTVELAELVRERSCEITLTETPEEFDRAVLMEPSMEERPNRFHVMFVQGTGRDGRANPPEKPDLIPECMRPFVTREVQEAVSGADMEEGEFLCDFEKQDIGSLHYRYYGFGKRMGGAYIDWDFDNHVFIQVQGENADGRPVSQVLLIPGEYIGSYSSDMIWAEERDLNHDGEKDLLLHLAHSGGSGGSWSNYCGFLWDKAQGKYVPFESLPVQVTFWLEDDVLINRGRGGVSYEHVTKYELVDGVYRETENVVIEEELVETAAGGYERVIVCSHYLMGELVSQKALEQRDDVRELYPEMDYWFKG